jgi:hypothetical protein
MDTHAEANAILNKAYIDIFGVVMKGSDEHWIGSAVDIVAITRNLLDDMKDLGIKVPHLTKARDRETRRDH